MNSIWRTVAYIIYVTLAFMNQSVPSSSCDYDKVHSANNDYNDGTDATYTTGATQVQTPSSANDAAGEWKCKYELLLAAQKATLASTPAPVVSAPIAAPVVSAKEDSQEWSRNGSYLWTLDVAKNSDSSATSSTYGTCSRE